MTYLKASLIVFGVIAVVLPFLLWQIQRACKAEQAKNQAVEDRDPHWGTDDAVQDALELLWDMPAYDRAAAAISEGLANLFEQLGPPPANEDDDHTTTNPTGES